MLTQEDIVSMAPDTVIHIEIGIMIFLSLRVVPEINGHRRKSCFAYKLSLLSNYTLPEIIEAVYIHSKSAALDLTHIHRLHRVPQHEAGNDISTSGNRR